MKRSINKKLKIRLLSIIIILISIFSYLLYMEATHPKIEEQNVPLYSYKIKSNVNYQIFLKSNILYDKNILEEGGVYITEFIDKIKTKFTYNFTGEREVDVKGDYDIIARVEGVNIRDKEEQIIWQKDFILLPTKSFTTKEKSIDINQDIEFKLDEYNEFARQVVEASKVNVNTRLNILMNININGKINDKIIGDKVTPSMVIPLNTSYFQILGNLAEEKPGNVEETKQVQLPVDRNQVIFYGVILGLLAIILILLIFFTEAIIVIKDPYEKLLKQIFKKHGDRLVALNSKLNVVTESIREVKSIDDLVRIADEVGKPILYKYSSDYKEIDKFYITNEDEVYILEVNNMLEEIESKKKNSEAEELMDKVKKFKSKSKDNKEESKIES